MKFRLTMTKKLNGLNAVIRSLDGGKLSGPEFDTMRTQWTARYAGFVKKRFDANSKGGGDWPPLALSTVKARRGPDAKRAASRKRNGIDPGLTVVRDTARGTKRTTVARQVAILRDTGVLFRALQVGSVGNYSGSIPKGVEFGFAGAPHAEIAAAEAGAKARALLSESLRGATGKKYKRLRKQASTARGTAVKQARKARSSAPATIAEIARYHNEGGGNLPQRLILAKPDAHTAKQMSGDLVNAIRRTAQRARGTA